MRREEEEFVFFVPMAKPRLQAAGVGLICLAVLVRWSGAYAFEFNAGWTVPSDPNVNVLNQWAERNRFQISDSIVFAYTPGNDSVLQVNQDDYKSCNTTSPIEKYEDGHTVFRFDRSGSFYFISGNKDNCLKNEKMIVVVLADRSKKSPAPSPTTPTPPPSPEAAPSSPPAPSPSLEPSAPPHAEQTPSPPPSETPDITPPLAPASAPAEANAPSSKEPSPNNAGAVMASVASSLLTLVASSLFLMP